LNKQVTSPEKLVIQNCTICRRSRNSVR